MLRNRFLQLIMALVATLLLIEGGLRVTTALKRPTPPDWVFDRNMGFTYNKDSKSYKVNSFSFYDADHSLEKERGTYRILVCGASFVLPGTFAAFMQQALSKATPGKKIEVILVNGPGIGVSDQYAYYVHSARRFKPDLVLSVFTSVDFARTSATLEGIRLRFDPGHAPRFFFKPVGSAPNISFTDSPIDPDFEKHSLKEILPLPAPSTGSAIGRAVLESETARLLRRLLADANAEDGQARYHLAAETIFRILQYERSPALREQLTGWNYPHDLELDDMFFAKELPPAFELAVPTVGHAYRMFRREVEKDNARLLVLVTDECVKPGVFRTSRIESTARLSGRGVDMGLCGRRIFSQLETAGVTSYNAMAAFESVSDLEAFHLPNDLHWNKEGNKRVGEALAAWLLAWPGSGLAD